eukprot:1519976-Rhodomonas_salina.1
MSSTDLAYAATREHSHSTSRRGREGEREEGRAGGSGGKTLGRAYAMCGTDIGYDARVLAKLRVLAYWYRQILRY